MTATTTQLLSSGEFYKLRYDTIPVKSVSANVSFYTSNSKMPNFELWHSCCKWAKWFGAWSCIAICTEHDATASSPPPYIYMDWCLIRHNNNVTFTFSLLFIKYPLCQKIDIIWPF